MSPGTRHPNHDARAELARQLRGDGIEFGPGCHPFPLGKSCHVRYCDRFDRSTFAEAYPELASDRDEVPQHVDYVLDFEAVDFTLPVGIGSCDFVIASHVLEHLANPLLFLERVHRLLRDDGLLFIAVPDKRHMFDRDRPRTSLRDIRDRYEQKLKAPTDQMIVDFINQVEQPDAPFGPQTTGYATRIEQYRRRSIHTNVWLFEDVVGIFDLLARELRSPFEIVDGLSTEIELLLVLRRAEEVTCVERYSIALARILFDSQQHHGNTVWKARSDEIRSLLLDLHERVMVLDERERETQRFVQIIKSTLERLPGLGNLARWMSK